MNSALRSILILGLSLILANQVNAQARQLRKTDSVFKLIKKHVYTTDADAIYDLADTRFRESISQSKFRDFLYREFFSLGLIKKDSLVSFINNVTAAYKIQYQSTAMLLTLSLDDDDKLDLFKLEPYTEPVRNKKSLVPSTNPLKTKTDSVVDVLARKYIQKANTAGLTIGIIKNGTISTYNYGETKRDNGQLPTVNTIFEIGSISKTFTATVLAWYVNEGKLNLNDPITKYLPDSVAANPALKDIKLVNLINHSSGLPSLPTNFSAQINYSDANPYQYYTREMLFSYLKSCTLRSVPGAKYAYSNLAVGLLGVILERVTGKTYEQLVTEVICKPLGMKSTEQHLNAQTGPRFVTVYNEDGVPTPAWDFDALQACGALKSTINDLLIYARANMTKSNSKLSKAFELAHQITFNNGDSQVALGWHMIKVDNVSYIFHNGGTEGSSSFLAYNIEKGLAVVILSNSGASTDNTGVGIISKLQ